MFIKKLIVFAPLCLLAACGRSGSQGYDGAYSSATDNSNADTTAVSAAYAPANSPKRKIIHTADYHCKVADVFKATTGLERLVKAVGGVVQESRIENAGYDSRTSYYTSDSMRVYRIYSPTSYLTLRVPQAYLDSVVDAIPQMATFVDSRTLKQNDVTSSYLSNVLKNEVGAGKPERTGNKPVAAREYDDTKAEQKIDRKIENLNLMDQVNYATLTVAFTQPDQVNVQTVLNTSRVTRTPFLTQCKVAASGGVDMLRAMLVGLINIWPVYLLLLAGWTLYRRVWRRQPALAKRQ